MPGLHFGEFCAMLCCAQLYLTLCNPTGEQAPLSMGFFRQKYWSGLPFALPRDLPDPGIESTSPASPAWQKDSLPLSNLESL